MRKRFAVVSLLFAICVAVAGTSSADDKADKARAQTIFKEGVGEMMAGNFVSACPKIAEAHRLTKGAGALFTLAECYAKWDKPTTATRHYRGYLKIYAKLPASARKKQDERAKLATTQIAVLSTLIPTLTILVPEELMTGVTVTIDEQPVANDALDSPLPLEVGPHRVVVTAADGRVAVHEVDLAEGAERRWEVKLKEAEDDKRNIVEPTGGWSAMEIAGAVIGITGIALVGVGSVTGGLALGKRSLADDHCADLICDSEGLDAVESGKTIGDVSTAMFVVGGVGLVVGLVLFLVGDDETKETVRHTPQGIAIVF